MSYMSQPQPQQTQSTMPQPQGPAQEPPDQGNQKYSYWSYYSRGKLIVGGTILLLIGLVILAIGVPEAVTGIQSLGWPSVQGTITRSILTISLDSRSSYVNISYSYSVNGVDLTGNSISTAGVGYTFSESSTNALLNQYPQGATVKVYYDPGDPSMAVLQPGIYWFTYFVLIVGAIFTLAGALPLNFAIRAYRGQ